MNEALAWQPERPYNKLPLLPPPVELETKRVLKQCITARAALAELKQAASRYLKNLCGIGILRDMAVGREKLYLHPKLLHLLARDSDEFAPYTRGLS
jgi:hypothetical protein